MKREFWICAAALWAVAGCGGGSGQSAVEAVREMRATSMLRVAGATAVRERAQAVAATGASFSDDLDAFDASRWQAAQWNNGAPFLNGWHPGQIGFGGGAMRLRLEADLPGLTGLPAVSGEYRSWQNHGHGLYQARLRASNVPGTVSAFFTYTGPTDGTPHDEIDVEILGDDPTRVALNYWTDGVQHPTVVSLGFDASAAHHDYAFRWSAQRLQWFVDGVLVHEEDGSRGPLPRVAGKIMLNHWGAVSAEPWSSSYVAGPATASVMDVERVAFTAEVAPPRLVSVGALAGSAWTDAKGWRAVATITVRDAAGVAVPGALVSGDFTLGGTGFTCTTGSAGLCSVTSAAINRLRTAATFTVRGIGGSGLDYNAAGHAADSVTVARP